MSFRGQKVQKVMVQPINLIFRHLQNKARVQVWLYGRATMRIEGAIIGFDEFMNLVMDDAEEVFVKTDKRKPIGRILLRGTTSHSSLSWTLGNSLPVIIENINSTGTSDF